MPVTAPQGSAWRRIGLIVAAMALVPVGVYFLSYAQYFINGHTWSDFVELHRQAVYFNLHLHATHTYASIAPSWIIDLRPVWYYFEGKTTYFGVIAIGNPFLWWMATLTLLIGIVLALMRRTFALLPVVAIILVLYLPWFATTRTSFLYYMTPVAPFMAILVAGALSLFAAGVVPRRGWIAAAGAALATALLWEPLGIGAGWLFWTLPRRAGDSLGWVGVAVGCVIAVAVVVVPALAAHAAPPPVDDDGARGHDHRHRGGVHPHRARDRHLARALGAHHVVPELDLSRRRRGRGGGREWPPPRPRRSYARARASAGAAARRVHPRQAMTAAMTAFCACRRFSAWSKTTECGEYSTSSVISSPQCAGRQCMTLTCGPARSISAMLTW